MAFLDVKNVSLSGVSACVPKNIENNDNFPYFQPGEAEKFISTTGVSRRRKADAGVTASDLCYYAAEKLIADLGWTVSEIDCLIFVSQTPDYILPATSCILQNRLGLSTECYTADISLGCSGWVYASSIISALLQAGNIKKGLLLAGDTVLRINSSKDKSTYPLFGDAGTASAFEYKEGASGLKYHFATDGSGYEAIIIPEGGYRYPFSQQSLVEKKVEDGIIRTGLDTILKGMDVFAFGISKAPESINKLVDFFKINKDCVDYFLFHQANLFMNEKIRKKLKLPEEKVPYSLHNYGNTSSATIPLTMVTELNMKLPYEHLRHIACAFGVGLSWGSVYFETNNIKCPNLIEL